MSPGVAAAAARSGGRTAKVLNARTLTSLLFVESQSCLRSVYREAFAESGYNVNVCESLKDALHLEPLAADVAFVSLQGKNDEIGLIQRLKIRRPHMEIVVPSSDSRVEIVVEAVKAGAYAYVLKPFGIRDLEDIAEHLSRYSVPKSASDAGCNSDESLSALHNLVGHSPIVRGLRRMVAKCGHSTHPLLLIGESGTGKELVARTIHAVGPNREHPFLAVDCASVDSTALERTLFGKEQGSETNSPGAAVIRAEHGTIFLNDVDKLSLALQARIARLLNTREVSAGNISLPFQARIIASSREDIRALVHSGRFRRDLYLSLSVFTVSMPPLRERSEDIPALARHFAERFSLQAGKPVYLSLESTDVLKQYRWPGNVEELEACVIAAAANCSETVIRPHHISPQVRTAGLYVESEPAQAWPEMKSLYEIEKAAILEAIAREDGDKVKAAEQLGIGKTTLYRKLKEYGAQV